MLKVINLLRQAKPLVRCSHNNVTRRTFLSHAYYCNEVWNHRLNDSLLQKVNHDELYYELDQRYQKNGVISAVDVDIFANSIKDDLYLDELLDLTHKLRMSADTSNALNSTTHAVIRTLLDFNRKAELMNALDDRLNYGLFLDEYTANILMDHFYKSKDFASGTRVASQLMLQEELVHPISVTLSHLHCYNYLLNPTGWPEQIKPEEPEEEVKVRVKYLRNPYDDEHFDLKDPFKIIGKILVETTKNPKDTLEKSMRLLGFILFGKEEKALEFVDNLNKNNDKVFQELINLIPKDHPGNTICEKVGLEVGDVKILLENKVKQAERSLAEKDVANQCEVYYKWEQERKDALKKQEERLMIANRLANIDATKKYLDAREERLWFFENEEKIELGIENKRIYYPKRYFGRKRAPKKVDESYIPPEVQ